MHSASWYRCRSPTNWWTICCTDGDGQTVLPYEHFSLVMSRSRRLAVYTAVNLDGERTVDTGPRKHDKWALDKRLPDNVQIDSFLYDGTPFDKGHLVRRLDPVWGETRDEALRAEADTFHYTNCSPQHEKFNRSKELWQGIENYILDNTDLFHLRVCLFNGPVFAPDDPTVKDVPIPREYWKVVTIRKADGSLSATAYLSLRPSSCRRCSCRISSSASIERSRFSSVTSRRRRG